MIRPCRRPVRPTCPLLEGACRRASTRNKAHSEPALSPVEGQASFVMGREVRLEPRALIDSGSRKYLAIVTDGKLKSP